MMIAILRLTVRSSRSAPRPVHCATVNAYHAALYGTARAVMAMGAPIRATRSV